MSLYPFPVPKGEAEQNAGRNYLWSEAEETTRRHRGQILVSTMARDGDVGQAARLQVKLVCAACGQDGVLGIYANGTVYQPEFLSGGGPEMMEDGSLPLLNLVWPGLYRREGGLCAYTEGLRAFGKDELEVLDTRAEPGDLRGFVLDIASLCAGAGCHPPGRGDHRLQRGAEAAHHPQRGDLARRHDAEDRISVKGGGGRTRTAERPET